MIVLIPLAYLAVMSAVLFMQGRSRQRELRANPNAPLRPVHSPVLAAIVLGTLQLVAIVVVKVAS